MNYNIILFGWLTIANVASFVIYCVDGVAPQTRMKEWIMLLLPLLGGSFGACLGNYLFNANYKHLKSAYWGVLQYWSGAWFIIELLLGLYIRYGSNALSVPIKLFTDHTGILGYYLLILNAITFVLQLVKGTEYYWVPVGNNGFPLRILVILIVIGGAPGALVSIFLFNFKYSNPTDHTKGPENIIYGIGVWVLAVIWLCALLYFSFGINVIGKLSSLFKNQA